MSSLRALLLVAAVALTANAEPLTWTLNNVTTLGSSITGSFVFDANTSTYSSINITSSGGSVIPAETWTVSAECCSSLNSFLGLVDSSAPNETGADLLGLFLSPSLTDAGGTLGVSAAFVAHKQRITLRKIPCLFRTLVDFHQASVGVIAFSGRDSFRDNGAFCVFPQCQNFNPFGNDPSLGFNRNTTGTVTSSESLSTPEPSTLLLSVSALSLGTLRKRIRKYYSDLT